jgi:hypothetical protein
VTLFCLHLEWLKAEDWCGKGLFASRDVSGTEFQKCCKLTSNMFLWLLQWDQALSCYLQVSLLSSRATSSTLVWNCGTTHLHNESHPHKPLRIVGQTSTNPP